MRSSGQTCVCTNRIYVHSSVYDEFAKKFADKVAAFKVGYGMDEGVTHGPLVNQMGVDKVQAHVDACVKGGAKVLTGGKKGEGLFFEPTVLSNLPDSVVSCCLSGNWNLTSTLRFTNSLFPPLIALLSQWTLKRLLDL